MGRRQTIHAGRARVGVAVRTRAPCPAEVPEDKKGTPAETTTPLSLMKRLNEYRKQCETYGEYVEAKKARVRARRFLEALTPDGTLSV